MRQTEQEELDEVFLGLQGWMKVTDLQKDGNLYLLLVRTSNVNNPQKMKTFTELSDLIL